MSKSAPSYVCTECGWSTSRWVGRCGECQTWGSVSERFAPKLKHLSASKPETAALPIVQVPIDTNIRTLTNICELDRVLGGGLVAGEVVLLAGEPGIGKSTLLLDVAAKWAKAKRRALYVSGEESASQIRLRAERTGTLADDLFLACETDLTAVLGHIAQVEPSLMILDSVQTIATPDSDGSPGGVTQVREVTGALVRLAKSLSMAVVIVGHVTKDGSIAGPRSLEHLVDAVLSFEGDRHSGFRMVRAIKNRYGPADEVGCFEMHENGIAQVPDPSGLFTSQSTDPIAGTCVTVTVEGRRPLLAEIQALVAPCPYQTSPKRTTNGLENSRIAMLVAVLERKVKLRLGQCDIYAATVGGAKVNDPSADLAAAIAITSSSLDKVNPLRVVALGEVGLAGDLRRVLGLEKRLAEAARMGFDLAVVPKGSKDPKLPNIAGIHLAEASNLTEALAILNLKK